MESEHSEKILIMTLSGQGFVVRGFSIMKPDVQKIVWGMLTCQKSEQYNRHQTAYGSITGRWKSNSFTGSIFKKKYEV